MCMLCRSTVCAQLPLLHRRLATARDLELPVQAAQTCAGLYRQLRPLQAFCVPPGGCDCVLSCLCCAAAGMLVQPCHPRCAQPPLLHCCLMALAALCAQPTMAPTVSPAAASGVLCMLGLRAGGAASALLQSVICCTLKLPAWTAQPLLGVGVYCHLYRCPQLCSSHPPYRPAASKHSAQTEFNTCNCFPEWPQHTPVI